METKNRLSREVCKKANDRIKFLIENLQKLNAIEKRLRRKGILIRFRVDNWEKAKTLW
jgi:hypothetical protein